MVSLRVELSWLSLLLKFVEVCFKELTVRGVSSRRVGDNSCRRRCAKTKQ
eukprot:m.192433 g.192433  ORF g.192433 m.192433 type:complete len:50 (-) comp14854_c1_seq1:2677-2826(-)